VRGLYSNIYESYNYFTAAYWWCVFSSCQPSAVSRKSSGQTLRLLDAPFPVSVAVNMDKLKNLPRYREIVIQEFSSITAENAM
jgi:endo-1,4-beta-xylanase